MNNIFNQTLEEVMLEAETPAARSANKKRLSKWALVKGVAKLTGARSSKHVFLKIINGSDNAARENELSEANVDLSTTDNSGNFITKEPLPAGNYLIGVDPDIYPDRKIPIGDDKYELRQAVEFEIPEEGPGQRPVNVELLLTKAQTTRHFDNDDAYVTAMQNGELKDGQIITIGPSERKFVVADDVTSLIAVDDDGQPLTPEEPTVVERNFYNTKAEQIIILVNSQEEEWLKEIYLSIFNNQKDLALPKNVEKLALLRVILSLEEPDDDVGFSKGGFELIAGIKGRLKDKFPDFNLQAYYEFEEEDELDEYGILLPDVDTISPKRSDLTNLEARESQYRDKRLFDIIKNVNLDIEEIDIAKSEETPSEYVPLDPDKNEPRFMIGTTHNGPATPALKIYVNDKNPKDGIPDDTWGYLFYGDNDPLGRRKKRRYDLNEFTIKWFGKTFKSYAKDNREDFTREGVLMNKDGGVQTGVFSKGDWSPGDVLVSTPNFWPIHVAMAYEELLETRTKQSAEQEYEAVLYFDTRAHKKRLKEQINNVKNHVRTTENKKQREYILRILNVDFVPRNLIVAPPKLKKILQKRVAYYGASAGTTIDPLTRKIKNSKPSFGNRDFGDIAGVLGTAIIEPLFNIGDNAKKYISGIGGRRISSQLIKLRVKGPTGESLYTHTFGSISIISESSQPPRKWAEIEDEVNLTIVSQPLEIIRPVNTLASVHVQAKSTFVGKKGTGKKGTVFEISNGSVYIMPKNVISNNSVTEDNATDYSFTEPEKIFAKRLGVRLDQDYKVDLASGKTNFLFLNRYTWNGDEVIKSRRENESTGGLTNKPYEPYAGSDIAPDVDRRYDPSEFNKRNKRTIELSEKSGVPAKVIFSIIKAESSPHYARAVNANQFYKIKTIEYRDKKTGKIKSRKEKPHRNKLIRNYKVPEEFFNKVEELRKEKNFKWNQGMKGISYKDHKKKDSVFEMLYELNPIAAIYVTAWGTYQIMGWNFVKDIDSLFGSHQEFKRIFTEGTAEEQKAASDKLFVYNHTVNPIGVQKVPYYKTAARTGRFDDWYQAAERYYGAGTVGLAQKPGKREKKRETSEIKKYFKMRTRGKKENKKYFIGEEEVTKEEYLFLRKRKTSAWFVGDGDIGTTGVIYGYGTFRYAKTLERAGRKWKKESRGAARPTTSQPKNNFRVLIFGHSQAGRIGRKQESLLTKQGAFVKRLKTGHGSNDKSLFEKLSGDNNIKKEKFSHAILHLHGNDYNPVEDEDEVLLESSKKEIVDYVINNLKVPEENISIYVPPHNTGWLDRESGSYNKRKRADEKNKCSKRRKDPSKRCPYSNRKQSSLNAIKWFKKQYPKANVPDLVSAGAEAFGRDGYHIRTDSEASKEASKQSLNKILKSKPKKSSIQKTSGNEPRHSYIVGDLSADGKIHKSFNENNHSGTSGASMNKPVLALIHLIKYPNAPQRLTDAELKGLLTYTLPGHESNHVNRLISGRDPFSKKLNARRNEIGILTKEDTEEYLTKLGLDPEMKIIYGGSATNQQTPKQYFDFMRLIHDEKKINSLGISEQVEIIKNHMKRTVEGTSRSDREAKRWPKFERMLRGAGYEITSLYGKGGLVQTSWNYSLVINDRYLVSIYTRALPGVVLANSRRGKNRTTDTANAHHTWFDNKLIDILDGVVPRKSKIDEALVNILKLIDEAMR